jgi:hypothetical protein
MHDHHQVSVPCTEQRHVGLDIVAKLYTLPHLGIEPMFFRQILIILLNDIFQPF